MSGFASCGEPPWWGPDFKWADWYMGTYADNTESYHQTWLHCPDCGTVMFIGTTCYYCAVKDWQRDSPLEVGDRMRLIAIIRLAIGYLPRVSETPQTLKRKHEQ